MADDSIFEEVEEFIEYFADDVVENVEEAIGDFISDAPKTIAFALPLGIGGIAEILVKLGISVAGDLLHSVISALVGKSTISGAESAVVDAVSAWKDAAIDKVKAAAEELYNSAKAAATEAANLLAQAESALESATKQSATAAGGVTSASQAAQAAATAAQNANVAAQQAESYAQQLSSTATTPAELSAASYAQSNAEQAQQAAAAAQQVSTDAQAAFTAAQENATTAAAAVQEASAAVAPLEASSTQAAAAATELALEGPELPEIILGALAFDAAEKLFAAILKSAVQAAHQAAADDINGQEAPQPIPHPGTPPSKHDPLVLDLTGNGINLTTLSGSPAYFDYNGSGIPIETAWITAGEGLLVMAPADGATVTAADMLGAYSGNGFADLAALDSNGDSVINASDAAYSQLRVWVSTDGSSGQFYTLAQLGITSIDVNSVVSGQIDNGNTIVATSTFSMTNPTTGATTTNTIAEVNLATNIQITQLPSSTVTPSQTALNLPNLSGFGFLPDLDVAVTADPTLMAMVENLVFNSATLTSAQFNAAFQNMLYEWAGATDISPTAYGENINGQHLAVIYAYLGINPATNPEYAGWEPNWHNGPGVWEPTYQQILQFYELAFMSQISQSLTNFGVDPATAYANPYTAFAALAYDPTLNQFLGDPTVLPVLMASVAPSDPAAAATYWSLVQSAIDVMAYTQGTTGIDGQILQQLAQSGTEAATLNAVNAINQVDPIFTVTSGNGYTNIAGDGTSITYAGTGSVEIPAQYCGFVVVPVGCTELNLDYATGATILLQDASSPAAVTFTASGSTLIATFSDGSVLNIDNFYSQSGSQVLDGTLMSSGGTVIPQIQVANDITAAQTASGSLVIQGAAIGGTLQGAPGNDALIANPNPVGVPGNPTASNAGIGTTVFDVGTGNDVLITSFNYAGINVASPAQAVIDYNIGDGSDLVYTFINQDDDPRAVNSNLGNYLDNLLTSDLAAQDSTPGYPVPKDASENTIDFGSGITASDITISAAGSQLNALNSTFFYNQPYNPATYQYFGGYFEYGSDLTAQSLVITVAGGNTITFTGGADTLQGINFADGTVLTAQQIGDAYVASEEAQNLSAIEGTELGNTLQGTVGTQLLLGFSGNDTLIAGAGNDTLVAGGGVNTYQANLGSGDTVIINNRRSDDSSLDGVAQTGTGQNELSDTLVFGAGIDPSQITVTAVASITAGSNQGSDPGLPDLLLTDTATGQTVQLTDENQGLWTFNTAELGNNGAAVGQVQFADGTVWSIADLLGMIDTSAAQAAVEAAYPGDTLVAAAPGVTTLTAGATPEVLAGALGGETYVVNAGAASVVLDSDYTGALGGVLDQNDQNVLQFGAGISESDVTVSQATNGTDLVLTIGSTGQTVTLANQLTGGTGSIIDTVEFADGTTWTNAQLYGASLQSALADGAQTISGSASISNADPVSSFITALNTYGLNAGNASVTLVGRGTQQFFEMGSGSETADVSGSLGVLAFAPTFGNDVINLAGAPANAALYLFFEGALPTSEQWAADGSGVVLSFANSTQTVTLENASPNQNLITENYDVSTGYLENWHDWGIPQVKASAGEPTLTVKSDGLTIDPNGYASLINITGNNEQIIYKPGYGAVTINITSDQTSSPSILETEGASSDGLIVYTQPGSANYNIDAAGDLTLNFGNGDIVTIDHEYNSDGSIAANGFQQIVNPNNYYNPYFSLGALGYESRQFDAVAGQTGLTGDGNGGVFNSEGIARTISDSGSNIDTIVYDLGYGALTIENLSANSSNTIEFGAGITPSMLNVFSDGTNTYIVVNTTDIITIENDPYGSALQNFTFSNGTTLGYYNLNPGSGSYFNATAGQTSLDGNGEGGVFNPEEVANEISDIGSNLDTIIYNKGYGAVTIGTVSTDFNNTIEFGAGITLASLSFSVDSQGDFIISAGGGDTITLTNGWDLVEPASGYAYGIYNFKFQDGSTATLGANAVYESNGSVATVDVSAYTNQTLNGGDGGPQDFAPQGLAHTVVGTGGADAIYYTGGPNAASHGYADDGALTIDETDTSGSAEATLYITDLDLVLSGSGDLGSTVGVSQDSEGDVTLDLGAGDTITLLGQASTTPGIAQGVGQIQITGANNVTETWTNTDIEAALGVPIAYTTVTEQAGIAGSTAPDAASGVLNFTDPSASPDDTATVLSVSTSGDTADAPSNAALLAMLSLGTLTQPSDGADGSVAWNFSAPAGTFAYLSANESLTLSYAADITNASGVSVKQIVNVTIDGTNQAPVIVASATNADDSVVSPPFTDDNFSPIAASGTIAFSDANLDDTHQAEIIGVTATGATSGLYSTQWLFSLDNVSEESGATPGSVDWSFDASNYEFSYLTPGETVTLTCAVQITDNQGGAVTQDIVVTVTGGSTSSDPVIVTGATTAAGSIVDLATVSNAASLDTASGTITFANATPYEIFKATITGVTTTGLTNGLPSDASLLTLLTLGALNEETWPEGNPPTPGSVAWNFAVPNGDFAYLATGETVTLTYTVQIADNSGSTVAQDVTVTITGANDVPVIDAGGTNATGSIVDQGTAPTANVLDTASGVIAFTDSHTADTHNGTIIGVTATGATGELASSATLLSLLSLGSVTEQSGSEPGTVGWNFTAPDDAFAYLSAGETVTLDYSVQIENSEGGTAIETVAVVIGGVNQAPVIVPSSSVTSGAFTELSESADPSALDQVSGKIAFTDVNLDDTHVASVTGISATGDVAGLPPTATLLSLLTLDNVNEESSTTPGSVDWTFSVPNTQFDYLAQGQSVTLNYTVQIADNSGATVTQNVAVTVTGTYDLPTIVQDATSATAALTDQGASAAPQTIDTATGSIAFTDVNADTTHTATVVSVFATGVTTSTGPDSIQYTTGVIPYLPSNAALLSLLTLGSVGEESGSAPGTVDWAFAAPDSDFNYLSQGESVTLNYVVQIANSSGGVAEQIVAITFAGTNDAPVIVPTLTRSTGTIDELAVPAPDSTLDQVSGNITFTDANLDDTHSASVTGVTASGDTSALPSTSTLLSLLALGSLSEEQGSRPGTVSWSFGVENGAFNYLSQGETLTLNYTVQIADNNGGVTSQNVVITINGADDVPVIVADATTAAGSITDQAEAALANVQQSATGSIVFTDAYSGDTHTATLTGVSVTGDTNSLPGTAALESFLTLGALAEESGGTPGSLAWTFSVPNGDFAYLGLGETATLNYYVEIANNTGGSVTQDIAITITGTNDVPVIVPGSTNAAAEITDLSAISVAGAVQNATGSIAFTDALATDTHTATVTGVSVSGYTNDLPSNAALMSLFSLDTLSEENGATPGAITWNFAVANSAFSYLDQGQNVTLTYAVQIANNGGGAVTQDVAITIAGTNDAPQIVSNTTTATGSVTELTDTPAATPDQTSGSIAFTDASLAGTHTVTVTGVSASGETNNLPSTATLLSLFTLGSLSEDYGTTPGAVAWNFSVPNGDFAYLGQGQTVTLNYVVQIANNTGGTVTQDVAVTITGTGDVPQIVSAATTATESVPELLTVPANTLDRASGSIAFTDSSLAGTHTATVTGVSVDCNYSTVGLLSLLTLGNVTEASGTAPGSVAWNFAIPNDEYSWLDQGQSVTLNYTVQITNSAGGSTTQDVAITIDGATDIPAIYQALTAATGTITELGAPATTSTLDAASGSIAFADTHLEYTHTASVLGVTLAGDVSAAIYNSVYPGVNSYSNGPSYDAVLAWLTLGSVSEQPDTTSGTVGWNFTVPNGYFDYLSPNEAVTLTYIVQIANGTGGTVNQNVTISITGTEYAPVIVPAATTATGAITELSSSSASSTLDTASGSITFTATNLDNTHTAGIVGVTALGATSGMPSNATLLSLLSLGTPTEESGSTPGSVAWNFAAPNGDFAYLSAGQTVTLTYAVQISDNFGGTITQNVAVTITGANTAVTTTAPVITPDTTASGTITEQAGVLGSTGADTTSGTINFTDTSTTPSDIATVTTVSTSGVTNGAPTNAALLAMLSLGSVTEPGSGTEGSVGWSLNAPSGTFGYLSAGEVLTLTYVVDIANAGGRSTTQDVTVTVTGSNQAPLIATSATTATSLVAEQANATNPASLDTAAGTIAFFDANLDDTHTATIVGVTATGVTANAPSSATLLSLLSLGSVTEEAGSTPGSVNWSFAVPDGEFAYLSAGESVTLTYAVQIADENGGTATQNVVVSVAGTNDAPVIVPAATTAAGAITEQGIAAGTGLVDTASGAIGFADTNLDDTHAASVIGVTATGVTGGLPSNGTLLSLLSLGTLTEDSGGTPGSVNWNFGVPDSDFAYLSQGETVTLNYAVQVADNYGGTVTQDVAITITGTNNAPVIASGTNATGTINKIGNATTSTTPDTVGGVIDFTDTNLDDTHSAVVTAVAASGATSGLPGTSELLAMLSLGGLTVETGTNPGSVNWTFAAPNSTFANLAANESITLTYTVQIADNQGGVVGQNVVVTINGAEDTPVTIVPGAQIARTATATALNGLSVSDPDDGAVITVTLTDTLGTLAASVSAGATVTGSASKLLTISGSVSAVNATLNSLTYTASKAGSDTITVKTGDGTTSNTQTIAETINATVDHAPVIVSPSTITGAITKAPGVTGSTVKDTATGAIEFTDQDVTDTHTLTATSVAISGVAGGLPASSTLLTWLTKGTVTEEVGSTPGSVVWNFAATDKSFDYLSAGQTVTLTYTVKLADNHGGYTTDTVTITASGSNSAPTIASGSTVTAKITEAAYVTAATAPDTASGLIKFADVNLADTHSATVVSVSASGVTTGLVGNATLLSLLGLGTLTEESGSTPGNVSWAFSAPAADFEYLSAGQTVTLTYVVKVSDNHGGTVNENVTVTVTGSNDAPVYVANGSVEVASIAQAAVGSGRPTSETASGVIGFTDPNLADTHSLKTNSVAATGITSGLPASATILSWLKSGTITEVSGSTPGSADWTFSAPSNAFDYLSAGQIVTLTYLVTLSDNHGGSLTQDVTITVTGTNDAPVIASGSTVSATITGRVATAGLTTADTAAGVIKFTDVNLADTHVASVTGVAISGTTTGLASTSTLLSWLNLGKLAEEAGTTPGSVAWSFSAADDNFDYLSVGQSVTLAYTVQVADNNGGTVNEVVTVKVNGVNYKPTAVNQTGFITDNWTPLTISAATLLAGATDPNLGDTLTLSSVGGAAGGTVALVNGNAVFTPTATAIGVASFTYTISDGHGGTSTATVDLTTTLHDIVGTAGGTITGGAKPAELDGGAGNETVTAGSAGDILIGGAGDILYGGAGADTFVFHAGFGNETVNNFTATGTKHDTLQFDTSVFGDWANLLGATKQQGKDLLVTLDAGDSILLKNVSLSSFTSADAKFV
jgi:VCBS repeat-containing protein